MDPQRTFEHVGKTLGFRQTCYLGEGLGGGAGWPGWGCGKHGRDQSPSARELPR
jgi:hypothetical protein